MITPITKQVKEPTSEIHLRMMLDNNLVAAAENIISIEKQPFKVIQKDGKYILEDLLEGADLWLKKFVTQDPDTIAMKSDARKLAKIDDEILILGDTGTGKELIARAMIGDRNAPFKRINCAAMPKELIESELFGHKAGAFTGAVTAKQGLMVAAKNGVLFLDEV